MKAQETFDGEIIVDNFAGGGGASTGIEIATGRLVALAVNHDPAAILMHKTNHPYTEHFQASVWDIDPVAVCRGRSVGLAWFSPDCKHFSKAKGAALVDRKIRGLAWITLRWAAKVRPRVIILENVEEFQTWGPVRKGKPVKKLAGTTFRKFIRQLEELGYTVEYRELIAADYGAPTSRKRFYMIARCDGKPIVWPKPTHSKTGADGLPKWRSAAEIIDWSLPCPSVFATKAEIMDRYGLKAVRPLAKNTMRRIIRGVDKFTIRSGKPFIVPTGYGERKGQLPRVHDIDAPVPTVVGTGKENLCKPLLAPVTVTNTSNSVGGTVGEPVHTVTTAGNQMLVTPFLAECNHSGGGHIAPVGDAHIAKYYGGVVGEKVGEPLPTVTAIDHNAVCAAHVVKFKGDNVGTPLSEPLQTVTASAGKERACSGGTFAVCKAYLAKMRSGDDLGHWPEIRALLNEFCGYALADDDVLLLEIGGGLYYIADIGLRMLSPRELYNAMGFPPDYIIDRDYESHEYKKSAQVARCGNAVCPPVASALVRANLPEWCGVTITTMAQLMDCVAV
jgi:DNA (cytosine-5)-methyltransferase 1